MRKITVIALFIVFISLFYFIFYNNFLFFKLTIIKDDSQKALKIVKKLENVEVGVRLAINDIGILGGNTKGWSKLLLINSKLPGLNEQLEEYLTHDDTKFSKKLVIIAILWQRTKDCIFLKKYFKTLISFKNTDSNEFDKVEYVLRQKFLEILLGNLTDKNTSDTMEEFLLGNCSDKKRSFVNEDRIFGLTYEDFSSGIDRILDCNKQISSRTE